MAARWECSCDHLTIALEMPKVEQGDEFDLRRFNPAAYGYRASAEPSEVLDSYPECCTILHVKPPADNGRWCFALYADGACAGNGTRGARASLGVYSTPGVWYNQGYVLPVDVPQTNQSAEIHAAIAALDVARAILKDRWEDNPLPPGKHVYTVVLVVMDSVYVVLAMMEWIWKWRANGFRNARGQYVANMDALVALEDKIRRLFQEHLVIVRFWNVPRIHNSGADRIAAEALRGNPIGNDLDSDLDELTERFASE